VEQASDTARAQSLVDDPTWLPFSYDPRAGNFTFAHAPRDTQRKLVFLDPRYLTDTPKSPSVSARALAAPASKSAQPAHFIFHTAFCCSTLLTRALDLPGVAMGVKEPSILVDLMHAGPATSSGSEANPLSIALDLLSRPLASGETQIIKPSNAANPLAHAILDTKPQSKALVLYSSLDAYLRSSARLGQAGRAFNRQMFVQFAQTIPLAQRFAVQELLLQTDLQLAAQVWLMQVGLLNAVARRFGPSRVRTLKSTTLLANKPRALRSLGAFLELAASDDRWAEVAAGPVFANEAKSFDDRPFDADAKKRADEVHAAEIAAVMPWAETLAAHCGVPLDLGDTLTD
jgi:hypothetical protein